MSNILYQDTTAKARQSNFELLRIFSMLLVLVFHADFWSLGWPKQSDFHTAPENTFVKIMFESLAVVCVNVFILISGWFGIRPSMKGLCNYLFQCLYFLVGIYFIALLTGHTELSITGILGCIALTEKNWFILAYLCLYILSPILNEFVKHSSRKTFRNVLIGYFTFQTIYGITNAAEFINYGYSTMSFMGLYLLARYLNLYGIPSWLSKWGG